MSSLIQRFEPLIASSLVACHASYQDGFRQRQVKFFYELFAHWIKHLFQDENEREIQITQITRFLNDLIENGYAKETGRGRRSYYRLTRLGLIELCSRIAAERENDPMELFLFSIYFLRNYRERLLTLVEKEGKLFPMSLKLELESLLDADEMISEKIDEMKKNIIQLEQGIQTSTEAGALATELLNRNVSFGEIIERVEQISPYEFHALKPLSELISELPDEHGMWELSCGNRFRSEQLWHPLLQTYKEQLRQLQRLKALFCSG